MEEDKIYVNIEESLINVQRGDVMIIKYPDGLSKLQKEQTTKIIRDMLITQGVDIPVLTFPKNWDIMMIEKEKAEEIPNFVKSGECWFCREITSEFFDTEFDTYLHLDCLKEVLDKNPKHPEAKHMKYLLED